MENIIKYEDIKKANEAIKPTDIKGKDYAEVNQRIKAFRMVFPTGSILTEMVSNENGVAIFKATITDGQKVLATGTAYEKEGSTFINKTSYIENCETSAVGRALGMAGFGIDVSVASAEEVQNAMLNQNENAERKATKGQLLTIAQNYTEFDKILKHFKVEKLEDLTQEQATQLIVNLNRQRLANEAEMSKHEDAGDRA